MSNAQIPAPTIKRLSLYFNYLRQLYEEGQPTVSSKILAKHFSLNSAQVRRDLSAFGQFGKRGAGYTVEELTWQIAEVLGIDKSRKVIIVGAGNLGSALLAYKGFEVHGFQLVAAFDSVVSSTSENVVRGKPCYPVSKLSEFVKNNHIEMAILSTPADAAQNALNTIINSGIKAILNFTPVQLIVPEGVKLVSVDLAAKLKTLSYFLAKQ